MTRRHYAPRGAAGASSGSAPGSDCVICARESRAQSGLEIIQIIEALSYWPNLHEIRILLYLISRNRGTEPARYRVVHRGGVQAWLRRFRLDAAGDPRHDVILQLYRERIRRNPDCPETGILFHPRVNCFGIDPKSIPVSLLGPGSCLEARKDGAVLEPEIGGLGADTPFTSFLLPPSAEIPGGDCGICVLELRIEGECYHRLVGDGTHFSVDSYTRLMRSIEYELPSADRQLREFYVKEVKPIELLIQPQAYDIVVFQGNGLGERVAVRSGSISIAPAVLPAPKLSQKALWFFGQPDEFYLELSFAAREDRIHTPLGMVNA